MRKAKSDPMRVCVEGLAQFISSSEVRFKQSFLIVLAYPDTIVYHANGNYNIFLVLLNSRNNHFNRVIL